jgi:hypothetical protein
MVKRGRAEEWVDGEDSNVVGMDGVWEIDKVAKLE